MKKVAVSLAVLAIVFVALPSVADQIHTSSIMVQASSQDLPKDNVLNGVLTLNGSWRTSGYTQTNRNWVGVIENCPDGWTFDGGWAYAPIWWAQGDNHPSITFIFDDLYRLDSMKVWNYSFGQTSGDEGKRGVYKMNIEVSYDGVNFVPFKSNYTLSDLFYTNAEDGRSWKYDVVDVIDFGGLDVMGVRFIILENQQYACYGGKQGFFGVPYEVDSEYSEDYYPNNTFAGLCNVEFYYTPVPEPATMSLLALGGLALLRRKR